MLKIKDIKNPTDEEIKILDIVNDKVFVENYDSYYLFRRRVTKLRYSSKLIILSHSNLID
jgi:hypothetical protein